MDHNTSAQHPSSLGLAVWVIMSADRNTTSGPTAAALTAVGAAVQLADLSTAPPSAHPGLSPTEAVAFNAMLSPSMLWVSEPATPGGPVQLYSYASYDSKSTTGGTPPAPLLMTCSQMNQPITLAAQSATAPQNQLWITRPVEGDSSGIYMIETVSTSGSGGGGTIARQTQYPIAQSPLILGDSAPLPHLNPYRYQFILIAPSASTSPTIASGESSQATRAKSKARSRSKPEAT